MAQYGFFFDGTRCTGCRTCEFACRDYNDLRVGFTLRRVFEVVGGQTDRDELGCVSTSCFAYYVSSSCQHCDRPVCVANCPTHAMRKDVSTGLVTVNNRVCIGCGVCATVCPYGAPQVDVAAGHSVKCDGCVERLAAGLAPVCVLACPARALAFGPVQEMSRLGDRADIMPFGHPDETMPNLFVKPSVDARLSGDYSCRIANSNELG